MLQEARIDAGVTHDQRESVERALVVHDRTHDLLGDVQKTQHVNTGGDAQVCARSRQRLGRRVARARTEPAGRTVDLHGTGSDREQRVGDAQREVFVPVEPYLHLGCKRGPQRGNAVGHVLQDQRARGVDDVDALAAGLPHDPRLLGQSLGRDGVRHHQEPDRLEADVARDCEVLRGDVRFGAMGCDADDTYSEVVRGTDVVDGAESGKHE